MFDVRRWPFSGENPFPNPLHVALLPRKCHGDLIKTAHIAQLNPQLQHLPFFCTKNAINSYGPGSSIRPCGGGSNCSGLGEHSQTVLPRWKSSPYFQLQLHRPEFFCFFVPALQPQNEQVLCASFDVIWFNICYANLSGTLRYRRMSHLIP